MAVRPHGAFLIPHAAADGGFPLRLGLVGVACLLWGGWLQMSGWSVAWLLRLHAAPALLHETWAALSLLGFGWPLLILGVMHAGRRPWALALLAKAAFLAMITAQLPKLLWPHPRPSLVLEPAQLSVVGEPVLHSGSMPSGHALAAFAVLGAAWLVRRECPPDGRARRARWSLIWGVVWTLAALAAWSRVAVGAHWPADVFVGAGAGLWVAVLAWRWEQAQPWQSWFDRPRGRMALLAFLAVAGVAWCFTRTGYPSAQWLQWALAALAVLELARRLRRSHPGTEGPRPATTGAASA